MNSEHSEMKIVSVAECDNYDRERICSAVGKSIDHIGGIARFVSPGQSVLVKPNLLHASPIEKHVTTHPEVVYAVARLLRDHGCRVVIGDSPGAGATYRERTLRKSYAAAGLTDIAAELGVELNYKIGYRNVANPDGALIKRFTVIEPALDADAIISVSKLKTHLFTYITGATKNLFGVIPGYEKPSFHSRLQNPDSFSRMLVDLNELMKPRLQIMDAVIVQEGDGPHSGSVRKMGAILASGHYAALDVISCRLMSIDPTAVGVVKAAVERGIIRDDFADITTVGDDIGNIIIPDFRQPKTYAQNMKPGHGRIAAALASLVKAYSLRPETMRDKCVGCGECYRICPVDAITMRDKKARIEHRKCIRCFSCHETCAHEAIRLDKSRSGRLLTRFTG